MLLECTPIETSVSSIKKDLLNIEGVRGIHDMHVWSLSDGKSAITAHFECTSNDGCILEEADKILREKY